MSSRIDILGKAPVNRILGKVEINTIIKKIEGRKLKQTERNYLSRSIRPKLIAAKILADSDILAEINKHKPVDSGLIEHNLALYGYPLFTTSKKRKRKMKIEDLICLILSKCPRARYIEGIPIILLKNHVDPLRLLDATARLGLNNQLGFLLETAFMMKPLPALQGLLDYLKANKDDVLSSLVEGDREFLEKTSPDRVKKWNLLGRFHDEDFKRIAEVYL